MARPRLSKEIRDEVAQAYDKERQVRGSLPNAAQVSKRLGLRWNKCSDRSVRTLVKALRQNDSGVSPWAPWQPLPGGLQASPAETAYLYGLDAGARIVLGRPLYGSEAESAVRLRPTIEDLHLVPQTYLVALHASRVRVARLQGMDPDTEDMERWLALRKLPENNRTGPGYEASGFLFGYLRAVGVPAGVGNAQIRQWVAADWKTFDQILQCLPPEQAVFMNAVFGSLEAAEALMDRPLPAHGSHVERLATPNSLFHLQAEHWQQFLESATDLRRSKAWQEESPNERHT